METLAVVILAFYAIGYFVLGGADIGTGMILPVLARARGERRLVVAAIVPFFLTSEVWLIATAGVIIGLFPALEGELFSGWFPLIVALVSGWVARDAGVWLRGRVDGDGRGARGWLSGCDVAVTAGSWLVAGSWAWIFASAIAGVTDRVVTDPVVLVAIAAVLTLFALHGLAFAALRLDGELRRRAIGWFGMAGEARTFALTSGVMAGLVVATGTQMPVRGAVAAVSTLEWLVPAILALTLPIVTGQIWAWRLFGHRIRAGARAAQPPR
ncbi:cytochrome d ubiquinol oxidase subunit II [Actinobacteria bacterium YIM 96077]|uniref:Cytochrome d ubiquinol oxidase subunit II n=1 Tax=Phytoactinopolyspora halophila TaxID=1981511 RepID=A0A329QPA1_9ACTN|nr:cytochrome d ubiquinol oxidase subunit II [Phytoactinopolyspora halophila]AYY13486.1 cytochrome d ubiquinol oxidase subunit II [Actinobacteria bacterium YIM 96077]RAW12458.1 cytochrome d ubiquinol oxidase subunit II [Phytoactinopolyspora halophila]